MPPASRPRARRSPPPRRPRGAAITHVILLTIACGLLLGGCSRETPPDVILYVSADPHVARDVVDAFEAAHGLRVGVVYDTEATKTTGLVERLRSERDHPQADVFWSSECFQTIALADEGVLASYDSVESRARPDTLRDPEGRWHGFAARPRVIVVHDERVPAADRPATWMDLTQPRWRGRIVMADPRFGTTGGHLGAMLAYWDDRLGFPGYYDAWLEGLADNETRLLPSGNAGVVEAVANGTADLGLTDTDDVWAAQKRGLPVALVYPRHHAEPDRRGGGTLLIPNTVALVAGAPHPQPAAALLDFLLSAEVEQRLAESVSRNVPVRPELAGTFPDLAPLDALRVDLRAAAARRAEAVELAVRALGASGGPRSDADDEG